MAQVSGCDVELLAVFVASLAFALWALARPTDRPSDLADTRGGDSGSTSFRQAAK
jgi:hypothetical protein